MDKGFTINLDKIKETFFIECEDHISDMEAMILELEQNPGNDENMNALFRAVHSIKGNSGCLGYDDLAAFTHTLETILDRLREKEISLSEGITSILLESVDCIKTLVDAAKEGKECGEMVEGTLKALKALLKDDETEEPEEKSGERDMDQPKIDLPVRALFKIIFKPALDILRRGIDPVNTILRKVRLSGEIMRITLDASDLPAIEELDPELCYLSWEILLLTEEPRSALEGCFEFVMDDSVVEIIQLAPVGEDRVHHVPRSDSSAKGISEEPSEDKAVNKPQRGAASMKQGSLKKTTQSTIRVETKKIDRLVNLVGELLVTQSMASQLTAGSMKEDTGLLQKTITQLEKNTSEIQEGVMSIRMLPIGDVFNRFRRLVRDLAKARGKRINLILSGEDTELDKTVIEKLIDPLTHLLRNSIDHGIECPDDRLVKGKPEEGKVSIDAFHEGGKVIITIEDDGKGLDKEKVVKKAKERGLIAADANLPDKDIYGLIFMPGFSTADEVTDISGRGVGMDVVKRNIEGLSGSVTIETEMNNYTRFTLTLPLTMAVIDGLTVSIGGEEFIIPITSVIESKRPARAEVKTIKGEGEVVKVRGNYVTLLRLHRILGVTAREENPWLALVVIISVDGKEYGLLVDELLGKQQVVIKAMGSLQGLTGIAGAAILGSGRVALILDGAGIVKRNLKPIKNGVNNDNAA